MHSYGWTTGTFSQWMGHTNPDAANYHDAIVAQNQFTYIQDVSQVAPGDLIAVKYAPGSSTSGHAMMVAAAARSQQSVAPIVSGTTQYLITVIDSARSGHGQSDTRVTHPSTTANGIGKGDLRVYVNSSMQPVGYTWSNQPGSRYLSMSDQHLAIGRLNVGQVGMLGTSPPPQAGSVTAVASDDSFGATDDETIATAGIPASETGTTEAPVAGCTVVARAQTGLPLPIALLSLVLLLGIRRRRTAADA
jgi:MYXO-CTERM domain-containing protein